MVSSATFPSFSEPDFVAFGALIGGFAGYTAAWLGGGGEDARVRASVKGSYFGTAVTLTLYVLTNVRGASIL